MGLSLHHAAPADGSSQGGMAAGVAACARLCIPDTVVRGCGRCGGVHVSVVFRCTSSAIRASHIGHAVAFDHQETTLGIFKKLIGTGTAVVAGLVGYAFYLEWDVERWDARIDALCAANGGKDVQVRVFETAMAPETKEYFAETKPVRSLHVPSRFPGQSLGPNFPFVMETEKLAVINERNPSVYKYVVRVVRVSDNKILGEQLRYVRGGGGMPAPDPSTPHSCPRDPAAPELTSSVFLNHPHRAQGLSK